MLDKFVFVYLDDILIFSADEQTHTSWKTAFCKSWEVWISCVLCVIFGFCGVRGQHSAGPGQGQCPSRKLVQRFLGFANFYRWFIHNFSAIAAPLHDLTSPQVPFQWSLQADLAFCKLRESFTSAPILTLPGTSRQFVASLSGLRPITSCTPSPFCPEDSFW